MDTGIITKVAASLERIVSNNKFVLVCTAVILLWLTMYLFPTSYWYELNRIKIQDSVANQPIPMVVDRVINRDFIGRWTVIVRRINAGDSEIICVNSGTNNFSTTAKLPENLTLSWWSNGNCKTLQEGFYRVTTIIHIDVPSIMQPKMILNESNIFKITSTPLGAKLDGDL